MAVLQLTVWLLLVLLLLGEIVALGGTPGTLASVAGGLPARTARSVTGFHAVLICTVCQSAARLGGGSTVENFRPGSTIKLLLQYITGRANAA